MNKKIYILLLILVVLLLTPISAEENRTITTDGFQISEIKGIIFQWKIENEEIQIILSAPTTGWVAIGFNPSRMMKDANILIGYVQDGKVFMEDHFGSGYTKHKLDTDLGGTDDITILDGYEKEDKTTLKFSIPLQSWDSFDSKLESGEEYKVIFAYGKKDNFTSYHKLRTSLIITL